MVDILETIGPRNGDSPLDYQLSELGVVDPQLVFAHFDGSAASGPWRPALTVRSQAGTLLGRVFPDQELAAGDSADVTYLPFRRRSTSSPAGATFAQLVATLATSRDLLGYWRLGDGSSPYADTSGNAGGPANMILTPQGTAMTPHLTPGALPPAQDDGAVGFNAATSFTLADFLTASDARFGLASKASWTLCAFVQPGLFDTQAHLALGTFTPTNGGYAMFVSGVTGTAQLLRGDAGGTVTLIGPSLPLAAWSWLVMVYGPTPGLARIYVNGVLGATHTVVQGLAGFAGVRIGGNGSGAVAKNAFNGGVDEAMIWGEALSSTEISALAAAAGI